MDPTHNRPALDKGKGRSRPEFGFQDEEGQPAEPRQIRPLHEILRTSADIVGFFRRNNPAEAKARVSRIQDILKNIQELATRPEGQDNDQNNASDELGSRLEELRDTLRQAWEEGHWPSELSKGDLEDFLGIESEGIMFKLAEDLYSRYEMFKNTFKGTDLPSRQVGQKVMADIETRYNKAMQVIPVLQSRIELLPTMKIAAVFAKKHLRLIVLLHQAIMSAANGEIITDHASLSKDLLKLDHIKDALGFVRAGNEVPPDWNRDDKPKAETAELEWVLPSLHEWPRTYKDLFKEIAAAFEMCYKKTAFEVAEQEYHSQWDKCLEILQIGPIFDAPCLSDSDSDDGAVEEPAAEHIRSLRERIRHAWRQRLQRARRGAV